MQNTKAEIFYIFRRKGNKVKAGGKAMNNIMPLLDFYFVSLIHNVNFDIKYKHMKKIYALITMLTFCAGAFAINYPGNGKTSFGGPVGTGSLDVTSDGINITFKFNRGTNDLNDVLVIYLDSKLGGFPNTKRFTDVSGELQMAISGHRDNGLDSAVFNFSADFRPDYALAFQPKNGVPGGALLVELQKLANFTVISTPVLSPDSVTNSTDYTVTIPASDISFNGSQFNFIATYISNTAYRSDEAVGDPMTGFTPGWNEYTSTTSPLIFDKTLPVVFGNFNGVVKGQSANLTWSTKTEINFKQFEVQKSSNGTTWQTVATVSAKNSPTGAQYSATDNNVVDAKTYYRLKLINLDGIFSYSSVIILRKNGISTTVDVLGNPVKNTINLSISNEIATTYQLELYTMDGRRILSQSHTHPGGSGRVSINVPGNVKGNCILNISSATDKQSVKIIVQ